MTDESKMLLSLLSRALFSREHSSSWELDREINCDWKKVLIEAADQSVGLLAHEALDRELVPEDIFIKWNKYARQIIVNNVKCISDHVHLDCWMREAGIPYVVLKGCASAHYYPDHTLRNMGDVDFIVPKEHLEHTKRLLLDKGLKPLDDYYAHASYINESTRSHFELHFTIGGVPEGKAGDRVREYIDNIFEEKKEIGVDFGRLTVPSDFIHGLVMLAHTASHLMGVGIGLRHLCDWAVFVERFSDEQFRSIFEERLKEVGLWKYAKLLTKASVRGLGATPKAFCEDADDRIADRLLEEIVDSGNFGNKKEDRDALLLFTTSLKSYSFERKTPLGQFMESQRDNINEMWPLTKKAHILLPVGWIFADLSNIWNVIRGKKKLYSLRRVIKAAEPRRELFRQFGLYLAE